MHRGWTCSVNVRLLLSILGRAVKDVGTYGTGPLNLWTKKAGMEYSEGDFAAELKIYFQYATEQLGQMICSIGIDVIVDKQIK